jgi:hypothetical protein
MSRFNPTKYDESLFKEEHDLHIIHQRSLIKSFDKSLSNYILNQMDDKEATETFLSKQSIQNAPYHYYQALIQLIIQEYLDDYLQTFLEEIETVYLDNYD